MRITESPITAIKEQIAFKLGDGIYRLLDYNLAVIDQSSNTAIIIEQTQTFKKD